MTAELFHSDAGGALVLESVTLVSHEAAPKVALSGKRIVRGAAQRQIGLGVFPAESEGFDVVELEPVRLAATLTASIDMAAAAAIALEHRATHAGRHVTLALARRDATRSS